MKVFDKPSAWAFGKRARARLVAPGQIAPFGVGWGVISDREDGGHSRQCRRSKINGETSMPQSVYKVIEVIGTSPKSWEEAAKIAVELAGEHLRDLRVAEVVEQDLVVTNGKVEAYRTKLKVSFKYDGKH
jgi:flavin-binding protein dodecin